MTAQDTSAQRLSKGETDAEHRQPGRSFAAAGLFSAVLLPGLVLAVSGGLWTPTTLFALAFHSTALILAQRVFSAGYPHRQLGLCNIITLGRLTLASALFGAIFVDDPAIWTVLAIASVAFLLDGADGWLARRAGLSSTFGAWFDMEVDSAFALILAVLAVKGGLSPLVLLLGLPRYAFGLAQLVFPVLNGALPERFSRKVVCVIQIAALITLLVPWIAPDLRHLVAGLAGALVVWSFAIDIRTLFRARS
ncbi:MAG: CDP-alcohol phosphatidyltransferase family protein [Pseudomonadota bacterium]